MALRTGEAEPMNMFLVAEQDTGSWHGLVFGFKDGHFRFGYRGVHAPHDVVFLLNGLLGRCRLESGFGLVADFAGRAMAPFAMAVQALTMIRPLESWLADVSAIMVALMAALARRMRCALRRKVVTHCAAARHARHLGMTLVIEWNRKVSLLQFIQNNQIRPV